MTLPVNKLQYCPHCKATTQFDIAFPRLTKGDKTSDGYMSEASYSEYEKTIAYTVWRCQVCTKLLFIAVMIPKYGDTERLAVYPSEMSIDLGLAQYVGEEIMLDYSAAIKCYEFLEYRACAAMARRSLQSSLIAEGAKKDKLKDQINELHQKHPNRFTIDIKDWAHNIRIFGNMGAHPDEDGLEDVDADDAKNILEFMSSYFNYVYKMPAQVTKARKTIADKRQKN